MADKRLKSYVFLATSEKIRGAKNLNGEYLILSDTKEKSAKRDANKLTASLIEEGLVMGTDFTVFVGKEMGVEVKTKFVLT